MPLRYYFAAATLITLASSDSLSDIFFSQIDAFFTPRLPATAELAKYAMMTLILIAIDAALSLI